jgi:hypothetical protein
MTYLYAPELYWKYKSREPELLAEIVNGCGPAGWKSKWIPDTIYGVSIREACNIHDFMYHIGTCEADRDEADRVFKNNMLRIITAESSTDFTLWLRRQRVLKYYWFVHNMGGTYFWADKNSDENFKNPEEEEPSNGVL